MFEKMGWVACLVLLVGCGGEQVAAGSAGEPLPEPPSDWKTYDSSCGFSFRAPADLRELPSQPIDSCVDLFETEQCSLTGDYGGYSDPLDSYASEPEFESGSALIDGRAARRVRFNRSDGSEHAYVAAVHFASVRADSPGTKLTLWASCATSAARDAIEAVFPSIRFVPSN